MNLYNIYDAESGLCLGQKKTAEQITNLFGIEKGNVYQSASRGYIVAGKYRLEVTAVERDKIHMLTEEDRKVMAEWDDTTEKARKYMAHLRER